MKVYIKSEKELQAIGVVVVPDGDEFVELCDLTKSEKGFILMGCNRDQLGTEVELTYSTEHVEPGEEGMWKDKEGWYWLTGSKIDKNDPELKWIEFR